MKKKTIGIPKAYLYYRYYIFWENFFKRLDCNIIVSENTTKKTIPKPTFVRNFINFAHTKVFYYEHGKYWIHNIHHRQPLPKAGHSTKRSLSEA